MISLKKLTQEGMVDLRQDLVRIRESRISYPKINADSYSSLSVEPQIGIDPNFTFANKGDVGRYFYRTFNQAGFNPDTATWNWLGLVYYHQLLNSDGQIGELERLFMVPRGLSGRNRRYPYVNLLKVPYDIYSLYARNEQLDLVDFLLSGPVTVHRDLYRELAKRPRLIRNPNFVAVVKRLFVGEDNKIKPGHTPKLARLIKLYRQYERGFDMYSMEPTALIDRLHRKHKEFSQFIA